MDDVNYFINVYSFILSYPVICTVDDCAFQINLSSDIQIKCILFKWIELVVKFFHVDVLIILLLVLLIILK